MGGRDRRRRCHERPSLLALGLVERVAEKTAEPRADSTVQERSLHGERVDALSEVLAGRLAELRLCGDDVEDVVADLEDHAERLAER